MGITSYSQNLEDVMLWRALGHIPGGTYIDIGAQDPVFDSVSLAFYEQGWRGIHVEPAAYYAQKLRESRPDEIVIQAAVTNRKGEITFFEVPETGISTADPIIAQQHRERGFPVQSVTVPAMTLTQVFHYAKTNDIQWLKIDVEGLELQVLQGLKRSKMRPWIIVVESVYPLTRISTHHAWEHLLLGAGYQFVYEDGVNRFYVSEVHAELKECFQFPPNIFDGYVQKGGGTAQLHTALQKQFDEHLSLIQQQNEVWIAQVRERAEQEKLALGTALSTAYNNSLAHMQQANEIRSKEIYERAEQEKMALHAAYKENLGHLQQANEARIAELRERAEQEKVALNTANKESLDRLQQTNEVRVAQLQEWAEQEKIALHTIYKEHLGHLQQANEARVAEVRERAEQEKVALNTIYNNNVDQLQQANEARIAEMRELAEQEKVALQTEFAMKEDQMSKRLLQQERVSQELSNRIEDMTKSWSWRVTAPLRALVDWVESVFSQEMNQLISATATASPVYVNAESFRPNQQRPAIDSLTSLLGCYDEEFIKNAYYAVLGRGPDEQGLKYYLARLRSGISKIEILAQLRFSVEGKKRTPALPELERVVHTYKRSQVPVIGRLVFKWDRAEDRQLRRIENQLAVLAVTNAGQYRQLQAEIAKKPTVINAAIIKPEKSTASACNAGSRPSKDRNQRVIYYYVDNTIQIPLNTGLQRVVRMLSKALLDRGEIVRFVKWDSQHNTLVYLNQADLDHLAKWNGPHIPVSEQGYYTSGWAVDTAEIVANPSQECWLFIPEVTHINYHGVDLTPGLVTFAKEHTLKLAFIFYDAIPLLRQELQFMSASHLQYMKAIAGADRVIAISQWSCGDLVQYTSPSDIQHITAIPLPAQSILSPRVLPSQITQTRKKIILCVGSISRHKNQLTLIQGFNRYCEAYPHTDWQLHLIGHTDPGMMEEFPKWLKTNARIHYVEGASDEVLKEAYANCAFTVFPSVEEGFGLPIVESLWFGKPCICADFGAMREVAARGGCVMVNTHEPDAIAGALVRLTTDSAYLDSLYHEIEHLVLDTWDDYADKILFTLGKNPSAVSAPITPLSRRKRIFWLGMHKVLVRTELVRLRQLGYEVFNPPYLSPVVDQSAEMEWDSKQQTTLPPEVFNILAQTNFFYVPLSDEVLAILNDYFDAVIVTITPIWLEPIAKGYKGKIIYRVYGQTNLLSGDIIARGMRPFIEGNDQFVFMPHAQETIMEEDMFFREHQSVVPYCLTDDVFGYMDVWERSSACSGEVALSCPNIANPYYAGHYQFLKQHFHDYYFKIYGVQVSQVDDPAVIGTLPRLQLLERWRNVACYLYTYQDPGVCYLPPIEMMVIGVPVVFLAGSLLDKYLDGVDTPARCETPAEALDICRRIRRGDSELIDRILCHQHSVRKRYMPSYVWPIFDRAITSHI